MNNPLVSVIIPAYNRGHLIRKAVDSVLNQTYDNIEIIIVDDCSTDNTKEVILNIDDHRVKYLKNETNSGPSYSRNFGIKHSVGDYIAFLDSDDEYYPSKIRKQIDYLLNQDDQNCVIYCGVEFYDYETRNNIGSNIVRKNIVENFKSGNYFLTPPMVTVFMSKTIIQEVGGFDDRLFANEDTELAIKLSRKNKYLLIEENLVKVTRNHESLMSNSKNYIRAREIIYEKHRDFLSDNINFNLCKQIANYYIIIGYYKKAKSYISQSLNYRANDFATLVQLFLIRLFPSVIGKIYKRKYKSLPLLSGLKDNKQEA